MKSVLLMCWMALLSVAVSAQDFASRFLSEYESDSNLVCITISPKMMREIMKSDVERDDEVLEIISNLKSMQMLTSEVKGQKYYDAALKVVEKNPGRFEPFLSFKDKSANCQIMVRKKNDAIIELVMLMHDKNHFAVINFTGNMSPEFISQLAASMKPKRS
ncbi:DUF4252 domain-containing protein [Oscillospiraceae bacterium N12]|jgi:hypothetical protein|uniref:DUF4252 domain-containing protein n=1 Tax=Jilunia laotingensis TaxID=2763675 RepID=A0A926IJ80_9BACT|nr:DUF4252 domain-containing protein [Jilunia laotingensis]MBC8592557.1 DUF4252 domain-containing protein [Jilunia laotingensis]